MKEKLKQDVLRAIKDLSKENLSLPSIIEYIDYTNKVRYTDNEVIKTLIEIIKARVD